MTLEEKHKLANVILLDFMACIFAITNLYHKEEYDSMKDFVENACKVFFEYRNIPIFNKDQMDFDWYKDNNTNQEPKPKESIESTIDNICTGAVFDFSSTILNYIVQTEKSDNNMIIAQTIYTLTKEFLKFKNIKDVYISNPNYDWNMFCDSGDYQLKIPVTDKLYN